MWTDANCNGDSNRYGYSYSDRDRDCGWNG
jgi:hypothetical protein